MSFRDFEISCWNAFDRVEHVMRERGLMQDVADLTDPNGTPWNIKKEKTVQLPENFIEIFKIEAPKADFTLFGRKI